MISIAQRLRTESLRSMSQIICLIHHYLGFTMLIMGAVNMPFGVSRLLPNASLSHPVFLVTFFVMTLWVVIFVVAEVWVIYVSGVATPWLNFCFHRRSSD